MYQLEKGQKADFENICSKWGINDANSLWDNVKGLEFTSPKPEYVFNAFKIGENESIIPPDKVKVLIIGQDPYPDQERADGLAFSFGKNAKNKVADDSLLHIFEAIKNYKNKCGIKTNPVKKWNTNLNEWARINKILLLNTALTHKDKKTIDKHRDAWERFIEHILQKLFAAKNQQKIVIFLWGSKSQATFFDSLRESKKYNRLMKRMILMTSHPSNNGQAYTKGFSEDAPNHFEACDKFLKENIWKNFPEN